METVGALSDGSDRQVVERVRVTVEDDHGRERMVVLSPGYSDQDVIDAVRPGATLTPTRKADIEDTMTDAYETWQRWKNTRAEAAARSLSAFVVAALQTREDAAWSDYVTAIQRWRAAT